MTFIHTLPADVLSTLVRYSGVMWLITGPTGNILDASPEFLRWIGYTHEELTKTTWMHISVNEDLGEPTASDMDSVNRLTPYDPFFLVRKQYVPKNEKPVWGELTITRYPMVGEKIEYCFCTWTPVKSGSTQAVAIAMEHCTLMIGRMQSLENEVAKLTIQTEEDRFIQSSLHLARKHPKVISAFLAFALSVFGLNNIVELLQRVGVVHLPDKQEKTESRDSDSEPSSASRDSVAYFL